MRYAWFRHFQSFLVGLMLFALIAGVVVIWKVNHQGFKGEWGQRLQKQLSTHGLHAEFSSVRLSFSRGLIAKDLKIYASEDHSTLLASVKYLNLDIDRSSALRGDWNFRSAEFENAFLRLPDDCAPHHLSQLSGQASLSREGVLHIYETNGFLGQLQIALDANLTEFSLTGQEEKQPEKDSSYHNFIATLHQEIEKWTSPSSAQPKLTLQIDGSLTHTNTLQAHFLFEAADITRQLYQVSDLSLSGRITQSSLLFEEITFHDGDGSLEANVLCDFIGRKSQFEVRSKASLERLLRQGFGLNQLEKFTFTRSPDITAKGQFNFPQGSKPELRFTGHLAVKDFHFLGNSWSTLSSDYSWQKGNLYLRDFVLNHPEGSLTGKLLFQDENIRYQATSTLPSHFYDPFIKPDGNIRKTLDLAKFTEKTKAVLNLTGSIRPSDLQDWSAFGEAKIENFSYNNVPIHYGSASFNLTPLQAVYVNPEVEIDLTNDRSFLAFGGPKSAIVRADQVSYDRPDKITHIEHLHGVCWPASVLRLFLPATASYIEETYRASKPPAFSSSGVIDHSPERTRTSFHSRIETSAPLYYDFLGKPVELRETSVLIHTHHQQVDIDELSSYAFSGPINGQISVLLPNQPGRNPDFRGSLLWTRLRLADIGDTYGFDKIEKGLVTGRLDFSGTSGKIETLDGTGNIGLEQGELFKAPVFGPLSPLIAGIQGHKRASHETARDASANFLIEDGILYTDDFITSTDSLTVNAEGSIDLARKTLDITARADTEGLLKLVTLPLNLTGFTGLFQFKGTGPVSDPEWKNTPFTRPKKEKKPPLFAPPPKAQVVPE